MFVVVVVVFSSALQKFYVHGKSEMKISNFFISKCLLGRGYNTGVAGREAAGVPGAATHVNEYTLFLEKGRNRHPGICLLA